MLLREPEQLEFRVAYLKLAPNSIGDGLLAPIQVPVGHRF